MAPVLLAGINLVPLGSEKFSAFNLFLISCQQEDFENLCMFDFSRPKGYVSYEYLIMPVILLYEVKKDGTRKSLPVNHSLFMVNQIMQISIPSVFLFCKLQLFKIH